MDMKTQTLMWTALPNGVVNDGLRLSIFVSPRLTTDETPPDPPLLWKFPDFLDWPSVLKLMSFDIVFENGPTFRTGTAAARLSPLRANASDYWRLLFPEEMPVFPYEFERLEERRIRSYPADKVMTYLKERYQAIANGFAADLPPLERVREVLEEIHRNNRLERDRILEARLQELKALPPDDERLPGNDFRQLERFHDWHDANRNYPPRTEPVPPLIDFHQMVSSLGNYPLLLRLAGLVLDVVLPRAPAIPGESTVRIEPVPFASRKKYTVDVTPRTKYLFAEEQFAAPPRSDPPLIISGMLRLRDLPEDVNPDTEEREQGNNRTYIPIQVDIDGAAIKAVNLVDTLNRLERGVTSQDTPTTTSLPSLQSAGIALVQAGHAKAMVESFRRSAEMNSEVEQGSTPTFDQEDLIRGFRVDVWDEVPRKWRSLCERVGKYTFWFRDPDDDSQDRVAKELDSDIPDARTDEGFVSEGVTQAADGSSDLYLPESLFRWAGWSLVAPRPGRVIQSNDEPGEPQGQLDSAHRSGLEVDLAARPGSLPRLRFGRHYRVRVRVVDLAGNSVTPDQADSFVNQQPLTREIVSVLTVKMPYLRFEPLSYPVVIPREEPRKNLGESPEYLVIRSNFDRSAAEYSQNPRLDAFGFTAFTERHIAPAQASQLLAETHGMFDSWPVVDQGAHALIAAHEDSYGEVIPEEEAGMPYLPDPLVREAGLVGLPEAGVPTENLKLVPFDGAWPDLKPFRLRLEEGNGAPNWDTGNRVLTVFLDKAEVCRIRLRSSFGRDRDSLRMMGLWPWMQDVGTVAEAEALAGAYWLLTPYRELTLVHAVQQPLQRPVGQQFQASKAAIGQTYATLAGQISIHGKSTGTVDVMAEWTDQVDNVLEVSPRATSGAAEVAHLIVEPEQKQLDLVARAVRHQFPDTKYRRVSYTAVATTRFQEYFPDGNMEFTQAAVPAEVDVLNSAPPDEPQVLYVVPAFQWNTESVDGTVTSQRTAGWLRVYLDRPWYSSGDGELLGVVLARDAVEEGHRPYVSQWGKDPIWESNEPGALSKERFVNTSSVGEALSVYELATLRVDVAGHEVKYDKQRRLWYADIQIRKVTVERNSVRESDQDSYFPFVRLALARYQPKSIANAHLSRIVLVDFVQLANDRTASVTFPADADAEGRRLTITVTGVAPLASAISPAGIVPNRVEVSLEQRATTGGDLDWKPDLNVAVVDLQGQMEAASSVVTWSGTIVVPTGQEGQQYRLAIKEFEKFKMRWGSPEEQEFWRLVYADTVEIEAA